MKNQFILILLSFLFSENLSSQQTPASKQSKDYSIAGATAHIGNGTVIENSLIVFSDGKIIYAGANNPSEQKGQIINASGKHVYPGFIAANTSLGLAEIDAVRATRDFDETGAFLPHIRSIIAYNAESKIVETMRPNGVLMAQIVPRGGTISGTSSIVQLDAWNWEDAVISSDDAIHVNWPSNFTRGSRRSGENLDLKPNKNYIQTVSGIQEFFRNSKNYLSGNRKKKNIPFEAVKNVINGKQKVFVHVSGEKAIVDAINTFKKLNIKNIVLVHANGAEKVADLLKENTIPVILERAHRLPDNEDEDYDLPYRSAKILVDKGITVGLGMEGNMERMSTRNLPFYAGTYAAYGLGKEEALKLITLNNAKILGIDYKTGTLTAGKDATLFISKGDALDMRTNIISDAFIQGRKISLETHQTKLWKRYSNKYKSE